MTPQCLSDSYPAVAESPEKGGKKGADSEGGGGEEASWHCAPGPAPPPQPAAGARQARPARWTQPGPTRPSSTAAQPESARRPAGSQEGRQAEVGVAAEPGICYCR